jgi:hypothetical protein
MLITKKMLLTLGLVAALVGGGIGSLMTRSSSSAQTANDNYQTTPAANTTASTAAAQEAANASQFATSTEQVAYRQGFEQGYNSCATASTNNLAPLASQNNVARNYTTYRPARRSYSSSSSRRVYYDYNTQPRGRSFWSKHRDKLTMAIGTGAGAAIGGLIGGKKGAGIGALAGLGGSALYTYKLRKRTPRY